MICNKQATTTSSTNMAGYEMNSGMADDAKVFLRSILVSKQHGVKQSMVEKDYEALVGERLPWRTLGYKTLFDFLISIPDVAKLEWREEDEDNRVFAVLDKSTYASLHAKKMSVKGFGKGTKPLSPEEIKQWKKNRGQSGSMSDSQIMKSKQNKVKNKFNSNIKQTVPNAQKFNLKARPPDNVIIQRSIPIQMHPVVDLGSESKIVTEDSGSLKITIKNDTEDSIFFEDNGSEKYEGLKPNLQGRFAVCIKIETGNCPKKPKNVELEGIIRNKLAVPGCNIIEVKVLRNDIAFVRFKNRHEAKAFMEKNNGLLYNGIKFNMTPATEKGRKDKLQQPIVTPNPVSIPVDDKRITILPQSVNPGGILPIPVYFPQQTSLIPSEKRGLLPTPPSIGFAVHQAGSGQTFCMPQLAMNAGARIMQSSSAPVLGNFSHNQNGEIPANVFQEIEARPRPVNEIKTDRQNQFAGFNLEKEIFTNMSHSGCKKKPRVVKDFSDQIDFIVTHAVDGYRFWIHLLDQENDVLKLMEQLQIEMEKLQKDGIPKFLPYKNHFGAAKYSVDGHWYRCWVIDCEREKNQIHVFYCDYGNDETINGDSFRHTHEHLWTHLPQAVPVRIHGLDVTFGTDTTKIENSRQEFLKVCFGKVLRADVVKSPNLLESHVLELSNIFVPDLGEECLEDFMVKRGHLKRIQHTRVDMDARHSQMDITKVGSVNFNSNSINIPEKQITKKQPKKIRELDKECDQMEKGPEVDRSNTNKDLVNPLSNGTESISCFRKSYSGEYDSWDEDSNKMNGNSSQKLESLFNGASQWSSDADEEWDDEIHMIHSSMNGNDSAPVTNGFAVDDKEESPKQNTIVNGSHNPLARNRSNLSDEELENLKSCRSLFPISSERTMKIEILSVESPVTFYIRRQNSKEQLLKLKYLLESFQPQERADPTVGRKLCLREAKENIRVKVLDLACNFAKSRKVLVIDIDNGSKIWATVENLYVLSQDLLELAEMATTCALAGIQTKNSITCVTSNLRQLENKESFASVIEEDASGKLYLEVFINDRSASINLQAVSNGHAKLLRKGSKQKGNLNSPGAKLYSTGQNIKKSATSTIKSQFSESKNPSPPILRTGDMPMMSDGIAKPKFSDSSSQDVTLTSRNSRISCSSDFSISDDNASTCSESGSESRNEDRRQRRSPFASLAKLEKTLKSERSPLERCTEHSQENQSNFYVIPLKSQSTTGPKLVDDTATKGAGSTMISIEKPVAKRLFRPHTPPLPSSESTSKSRKDLKERLISSIESLAQELPCKDIVAFKPDGSLDREMIERQMRYWASEEESLRQYADTLNTVLSMPDDAMVAKITKNRQKRLELHVKILSARKELDDAKKQLDRVKSEQTNLSSS